MPASAAVEPGDPAFTRPPAAELRLVEEAVIALRPFPRIGSNTAPEGLLRLRKHPEGAVLSGRILGLRPGEHGLHIHERGNCSTPDAAGGHFNPGQKPHRARTIPLEQRHTGDLGNIAADRQGRADVDIMLPGALLQEGEHNVLGRSVIVHADRDDLVTQPSGGSGERVACGIIRAGNGRETAKAPRVGEVP